MSQFPQKPTLQRQPSVPIFDMNDVDRDLWQNLEPANDSTFQFTELRNSDHGKFDENFHHDLANYLHYASSEELLNLITNIVEKIKYDRRFTSNPSTSFIASHLFDNEAEDTASDAPAAFEVIDITDELTTDDDNDDNDDNNTIIDNDNELISSSIVNLASAMGA